jgi:type III secretion system YscD/HrpQ family protein
MNTASDRTQAPTNMATLHGKHRTLRVLSGMHTGAESTLQAERVLVGNLEDECDIMLNVGLTEPHACLLRMSADGWTVLSIAGNLWVDETHVELQKKSVLRAGSVLTLGRVGFAISDSDAFDWSKVKPPFNLVRPDPSGPLPAIALAPSAQDTRRKWHAIRLAAGIGVSCLVMASAAAYVTQILNKRAPSAEAAGKKLEYDKQMIAALPSGKEVSLVPYPESPGKVIVQGYVASKAEAGELAEALKKAETNADIRVTPVDDLSKALKRRFTNVGEEGIRYDENGRFVVTSKGEDVPVHDKQARMALQEVPSVTGLDLSVSDMQTSDGAPVVVKYARRVDRPSDVTVTNLDAALGRKPFTVLEMRGGDLPSVVLEDRMRYFVGGKVPNGSTIKSINNTTMVMLTPQGVEREISLADTPRQMVGERVADARSKPTARNKSRGPSKPVKAKKAFKASPMATAQATRK